MTTTRKRGEKFASKGRNKRGDKSQKKAKKWCDICTCDDHIEVIVGESNTGMLACLRV